MFNNFIRRLDRSSPHTWTPLTELLVDFGRWDTSFVNTFHDPKSVVITGAPGLGKTTYLLWALSSVLQGRLGAWFSNAVVVNRQTIDSRLVFDSFMKHGLSQATTAVIIDSPFDIDDTIGRRTEKASQLAALADDFNVIATMRDDEYNLHARYLEAFERPSLGWNNIRFTDILENRIMAWGGPSLDLSRDPKIESLLRDVSSGTPLYLDLFANTLAQTTKIDTLTIETLNALVESEDIPRGLMSLIWQIVHKLVALDSKASPLVLFLLKLYERRGISLSNHFQMLALQYLCENTEASPERAFNQLQSLREYLNPGSKRDPLDILDTQFFSLDSSWRTILSNAKNDIKSGRCGIYRDVVQRYLDTDYEQILSKISSAFTLKSETGIDSTPQLVICADLIRAEVSEADSLTQEALKFLVKDSQKVEEDVRNDLIYDAWLSAGFAKEPSETASFFYDQAFSVSISFTVDWRKRHEALPLSHCITFERLSLLPFENSDGFDRVYRRLAAYSDRLIALDPTDNMSHNVAIRLDISAGEYKSACHRCSEALQNLTEHTTDYIQTLILWATALTQWSRDPMSQRYKRNHLYMQQAVEKLSHARRLIATLRNDNSAPVRNLALTEQAIIRTRRLYADKAELSSFEQALRIQLTDEDNSSTKLLLAKILFRLHRVGEAQTLLKSAESIRNPRTECSSLVLIARCFRSSNPPNYSDAEEYLDMATNVKSRIPASYDYQIVSATLSGEYLRLYTAIIQNTMTSEHTELDRKLLRAGNDALTIPVNRMWHGHYNAIGPLIENLEKMRGLVFEMPIETQPPPSLRDWPKYIRDLALCGLWFRLGNSFDVWVSRLQMIEEDKLFNNLGLNEICEALQLYSMTEVRLRSDLSVMVKRYYAPIALLVMSKFPMQTWRRPASDSKYIYEIRINEARHGNKETRRYVYGRLRSQIRKSLLDRAIMIDLNPSARSRAAIKYLEQYNSFKKGNWTPTLSYRRVLADGLLFRGCLQEALFVWRSVADLVDWPERFFVLVLCSAIEGAIIRKQRKSFEKQSLQEGQSDLKRPRI